MKIVKQIIFSLFALLFIHSGLNKIFNYMPPPELTPQQLETVGAFMKLKWLMPLVAVAEIAGGILVILPRTRALGAIVIFPVMTGIFLHHATMEPAGLAIAVVLLIVNLWMIADNYKKYRPLVS